MATHTSLREFIFSKEKTDKIDFIDTENQLNCGKKSISAALPAGRLKNFIFQSEKRELEQLDLSEDIPLNRKRLKEFIFSKGSI